MKRGLSTGGTPRGPPSSASFNESCSRPASNPAAIGSSCCRPFAVLVLSCCSSVAASGSLAVLLPRCLAPLPTGPASLYLSSIHLRRESSRTKKAVLAFKGKKSELRPLRCPAALMLLCCSSSQPGHMAIFVFMQGLEDTSSKVPWSSARPGQK